MLALSKILFCDPVFRLSKDLRMIDIHVVIYSIILGYPTDLGL